MKHNEAEVSLYHSPWAPGNDLESFPPLTGTWRALFEAFTLFW